MSLLSDDSFLHESPLGVSPETPGPFTPPPPSLPSPTRHHFPRSASSPYPHTHTHKPQIRFAPLVHITSGIKDVPANPSILQNAADRITSQPAFLNIVPGFGQQPSSASSSLASSFDMPLRMADPIIPGVGLDQVTPPKRKLGRKRKPTPLAKPITSTSRFYERLTDDEDDPSSDEGENGSGKRRDPFADSATAVPSRPTSLKPPVQQRLRLAYSPSLEDLAASEARERAALLASSESKRRQSYGTSGMRKNGQSRETDVEEKAWWRDMIACWGCWDDDGEDE